MGYLAVGKAVWKRWDYRCTRNVSFARTDVTGQTISNSRSCRAKTSITKRDVTTSNREKVGRGRP